MSPPQPPLTPAVRPYRPVDGHRDVCAALVALWDALVSLPPVEAERALTDRVAAAFLPGLDVPKVLAYLDHDRTRRTVKGCRL